MSEKQQDKEKKNVRMRKSFTESILMKVDKKGKEINAPAYQQIRNAIELQLNRLLELCQHEKKRWRTLKKYSKEELQEYLATLED